MLEECKVFLASLSEGIAACHDKRSRARGPRVIELVDAKDIQKNSRNSLVLLNRSYATEYF